MERLMGGVDEGKDGRRRRGEVPRGGKMRERQEEDDTGDDVIF